MSNDMLRSQTTLSFAQSQAEKCVGVFTETQITEAMRVFSFGDSNLS